MRHTRHLFETVTIMATVSICIALSTPALAQSTLSPAGGSAVLPAPEPQFGGVIGRTAKDEDLARQGVIDAAKLQAGRTGIDSLLRRRQRIRPMHRQSIRRQARLFVLS